MTLYVVQSCPFRTARSEYERFCQERFREALTPEGLQRTELTAHRLQASKHHTRRREKEVAVRSRWKSKDRTMAELLEGMPFELRPKRKT